MQRTVSEQQLLIESLVADKLALTADNEGLKNLACKVALEQSFLVANASQAAADQHQGDLDQARDDVTAALRRQLNLGLQDLMRVQNEATLEREAILATAEDRLRDELEQKRGEYQATETLLVNALEDSRGQIVEAEERSQSALAANEARYTEAYAALKLAVAEAVAVAAEQTQLCGNLGDQLRRQADEQKDIQDELSAQLRAVRQTATSLTGELESARRAQNATETLAFTNLETVKQEAQAQLESALAAAQAQAYCAQETAVAKMLAAAHVKTTEAIDEVKVRLSQRSRELSDCKAANSSLTCTVKDLRCQLRQTAEVVTSAKSMLLGKEAARRELAVKLNVRESELRLAHAEVASVAQHQEQGECDAYAIRKREKTQHEQALLRATQSAEQLQRQWQRQVVELEQKRDAISALKAVVLEERSKRDANASAAATQHAAALVAAENAAAVARGQWEEADRKQASTIDTLTAEIVTVQEKWHQSDTELTAQAVSVETALRRELLAQVAAVDRAELQARDSANAQRVALEHQTLLSQQLTADVVRLEAGVSLSEAAIARSSQVGVERDAKVVALNAETNALKQALVQAHQTINTNLRLYQTNTDEKNLSSERKNGTGQTDRLTDNWTDRQTIESDRQTDN
jgi:hypothetical protein